MIELMFLGIVAGGGSLFGYIASRKFVRERLWAIDAVRSKAAPIIAGIVAGGIALPVVGLLPVLGIGSAILFGAAVGAGVSAGARDTRALPRA